MSTNIKNSDGSLTKIAGKTLQIPINAINNSTDSLQDAPVGHIISYMGTIAPIHYLICDGSTYNISDYPKLAEHFLVNFGSKNYFGGDGTATFAVPDLRGEFLRGTGTNSHTNQGNGANAGTHQDSTTINYIFVNSSGQLCSYNNQKDTLNFANEDYVINAASNTGYKSNVTSYSSASTIKNFAVRPTNTSVLYCIKAEPTYFMEVNDPGYSTDEIFTGKTWINGKPIYRRVSNERIKLIDKEELIGNYTFTGSGVAKNYTIDKTYLQLKSVEVGESKIIMEKPIPIDTILTIKRKLFDGNAVNYCGFWLGSTKGGNDLYISPSFVTNINNSITDTIDLRNYNSPQVYLTLRINVVGGNSAKYQFDSITIDPVYHEYDYIIKNNVEVISNVTHDVKYISEYTKNID